MEAGREKFEWVSGVAKRGFQSFSAPDTLVVFHGCPHEGDAEVICRSASESGEISSPTSVSGVVINFTGCEAFSQPDDCTAVVTVPLEGVLGIQKVGTNPPLNDMVALELCDRIRMHWRAVRHPWLDPAGCAPNKMTLTPKEQYVQKNGEQKPDSFAGEPEDAHTLGLSFRGPFEELGWSISFNTDYEEAVEISTLN